MNYKNTILVICFLLVLNWSCESKKQTEMHHPRHTDSTTRVALVGPVADLEREVLAVHDSLMVEMSDLMRLQKEVSTKLETAESLAKERGLQIGQQLTEADEVMMDWMHDYKGDTLRQLDEKNALAYLKSQQIKVKYLSRQLRKSIKDAESYLKE